MAQAAYTCPLLGDERKAYLESLGSDFALRGHLALPCCLGGGSLSHGHIRFLLLLALGKEGGHRRLRPRFNSLSQSNAKKGISIMV